TTGQAPQREQGTTKSGQHERSQDQKAQQNQKAQDQKAQQQRGQRDQTTGQAPREQGQSPTQSQQTPRDQGTMQRQQSQQPGQAQQQQGGGNVQLTTEQRPKIRQTVLTGANVPRASNVNFSISVGTVVPTSVRVVEVPPALIEIHPDWRGHLYFVVGDEIIIVDRNHRIIAVVAV